MKLFITIFVTIFLAELGDKTQLATLLFASNIRNPKLVVFVASSAALIATSALGVLVGSVISQHITPRYISWGAGLGFILVGIWTILSA